MIGALDLLSTFKDRLNDQLTDCRNAVGTFANNAGDMPELFLSKASDTVVVSDSSLLNRIDSFIDENIVPYTDVDEDGHVYHFLKYTFGSQNDAYILYRIDEQDHVINVLDKELAVGGGYQYNFHGWNGSTGSFQDLISPWANAITQNEIIIKAIELAENGTLTASNFSAAFFARLDALNSDAKHVYDLILNAISQSTVGQRIAALLTVIKSLFDGWNEATITDGRIYFNNTDFTVNTNFMIPWKLVTSLATTVIAAAVAIINPLVGAIVAGVSTVATSVVDAISDNTSNEVKCVSDAARDNDCFAQPILQIVYDMSEGKSYMTNIADTLNKYGRCKIVNGAFTTYCWVGDQTPYNEYSFSTICIETYISMLSDLDLVAGIPEQDYILTGIDNSISTDWSVTETPGSYYSEFNYSMDAVGTPAGINGLKTNLEHAYGSRTSSPSQIQPGDAQEFDEFNGVTKNYRLLRRLSRGLLLYLSGLHIAVREMYPTGENQYCTGSYTDTDFYAPEGSSFSPFQNKDWNFTLENCKKIIAYWLATFKQYNSAHTTSSYKISFNEGWAPYFNQYYLVNTIGDLAKWFQGMCNAVIPAIRQRANYMMSDQYIDWFDAVAWFLRAMPAATIEVDDANNNYIKGASASSLIVPNISNECNAYVYPPHNTVSIWARVAITAAVVTAVAITAAVVTVKVKNTIARKAALKRADVKSAYDRFLETGSKEDWNLYRKVNRQYKNFWGALSGVSYDATNNWCEYSVASAIDSDSVNSLVRYFQQDVENSTGTIISDTGSIKRDSADIKSTTDTISNNQLSQEQTLNSIKNLIKSSDL